MDGIVHDVIPKNAIPGLISYKYPPANVKMAVLKPIAKEAYIPCAVGISFCDSRLDINWIKA